MYLGIRSVIYPAPDIAAARDWFAAALGIQPYFDEPFYVGFNLGGYELGLEAGASVEAGPISYWGVDNVDVALADLLAAGAEPRGEVLDLGDGLRMATVTLPNSGGVFGVIENPHFILAPVDSTGPGR
jgi:catechol 2,3-dioxygenase-like lactoylglutathione lyase family enzyme